MPFKSTTSVTNVVVLYPKPDTRLDRWEQAFEMWILSYISLLISSYAVLSLTAVSVSAAFSPFLL